MKHRTGGAACGPPGVPLAEPASHQFGNYEILALLGQGGMAAVYKARELSGPRAGWTVALKRLRPELSADPTYVRLFRDEATLCTKLSHPNVVSVYEVGEVQGVQYMTMEHVDGRDLGQVLARCRQRGIQLPIDFAVYLARVLLLALSGAHELGIVHCDVSPSNLFVSRLGEVKLGDFGVARSAATTAEGLKFVAGKPHYASPEVLRGQVTAGADLWAANAVLYELLTLDRPFQGATPEGVFDSIIKLRYRLPREIRQEISPSLEAQIVRGFDRKPALRFPDAFEFAWALFGHYDERVGTPLAIAAVVRGLFGAG
jgi:serine/threonine protein kinase